MLQKNLTWSLEFSENKSGVPVCVCLCGAWKVGVATEAECEHEQQAMADFQRGAVPPPHSARTFLIFRPN